MYKRGKTHAELRSQWCCIPVGLLQVKQQSIISSLGLHLNEDESMLSCKLHVSFVALCTVTAIRSCKMTTLVGSAVSGIGHRIHTTKKP